MKKLTKLLVFFLFVFLLLSSAAFAQQKVVTSEGRYMLGLLDSKKDAKALALIDAKKQAIEDVINYLEGMPEVKTAKLTKDQINTLATCMMSVDVLSEDWKTSGESTSVVIQIRTTIDASKTKDKIAKMREDDQTETIKEMQIRLTALQKELAELKDKQLQQANPQKTETPVKEQKESAPLEAQKQTQGTPDIKKSISNEQKKKYENVLKNVFALDFLGKGQMALGDQRWYDAQYVFGKAIELNPGLVEAYIGMSCALHNLKQSLEALTFVNVALKINPQSVGSLGIKALILKDQPGKINQALVSANNAVKLKPDNPRFYRIRAEVYEKMGKTILARKDFAAACNIGAKESCEKAKPLKQKPEAGKKKT